ncbi:hypothetical protein [Bradyrhizobium sp.]|uniref:hypothetical protein n=1 Tax=Bradyrhizobium sp. TaxID=376 RepID=UPI003C747E34
MDEGGNGKPFRPNNDKRTAVRRGLAEMRERKLASDEAIATVFDRYRSIDATTERE